MSTEQMRRHAEHCLEMAAKTADETMRIRYRRAAKAWQAMAERKERLDQALLPDIPEAKARVDSVA